MKGIKINKQFQIGFSVVAVFAIVIVYLIFPVQFSNIVIQTPLSKANNPNLSGNIQNGPATTATFVNTTKTYITAPNPTQIVQNFADASGCTNNSGLCSISSPKMEILVNSVVFDSNQVQYKQGTYISIPPLSLVPSSLSWLNMPFSFITQDKKFPVYSSSGKLLDNVHALSLTANINNQQVLLDLGSVQTGFFVGLPQDAIVNVYGDYAVYLDDVERQAGHFAGNGQTINQQLALSINNLPALTFTFSDEFANAQNGTQHIYRILVGNVTGTYNVGTNSNSFSLTKTTLAYVLVMTLDNGKKTIIGADNQAVAIFKSDDRLYTTTTGSSTGCYAGDGTTCYGSGGGPTFSVTANGFVVPNNQIPRNSNIIITVNGMNYPVATPITQQDYVITCSAVSHSSTTDPHTGVYTYGNTYYWSTYSCTSNFGFSQ